MKFLQIHTFYSAYLARHYAAQPQLMDAPHAAQMQALLADGFGAAHMWAPVLAQQGHEASLIIANDVVSQFRWVAENVDKLKLKKKSEWMREIALEQVNRFQPEVLYLGDPVAFDMSFVRRLKQRPKQVIAWRAAPTPAEVDWKGIDLMLSHLPPCQKQAWRAGVRDVRFFYPGFCQWVADAVKDEPQEYDLVFCGQWSDDHEKRNNLIAKLAKASLSKEKPFSFGLFLECADPSKMPESVRKLNRGGRWGMEMYRALRRGRIALNAEINMGRGHAGNMRLFEATGCGVCTLSEQHENMARYFEPGREVLTFQRVEDCLETLHRYLQDTTAREALAQAGQQRCLGEHAIEKRMTALTDLLQHPARGPMAWLRRTWNRARA